MSQMGLLSQAQMARISPLFPLSHRMPRVDDRPMISGIIFVRAARAARFFRRPDQR